MKALVSLLYGFASYILFLGTILYLIGFVGNVAVSKSIDTGPTASFAVAALVDLLLLASFAVQHSVMARSWFKRWWTQFVPKSVERSTYVLFASLLLALLLWQWRPIPARVWNVTSPLGVGLLHGSFWTGWLLVFGSTYLIDHFELFGLKQVILRLTGKEPEPPTFKTPLLYRYVRHPLYLGFLVAFWSTPVMTAGHLLFTIGMTSYILVAVRFEERDLVRAFGNQYRRYRARVGMLFPRPAPSREEPEQERSPSSA